MRIKSKSKRLNDTYQKVFRNRHVIAKNESLTDQEYRLWDLYVALYDWDKKHSHYGCVVDTDKHIAEMLNWSEAKVCRTRKKLIIKGVVSSIERSVIKVWPIPGYIEKWIAPMKPDFSKPQEENDNFERISFGDDRNQDQNSIIYDFPIKDKYSFICYFDEYLDCKKELEKISKITSLAVDARSRNQPKMRQLIELKEKYEELIKNYEERCPEKFIGRENEEEMPF